MRRVIIASALVLGACGPDHPSQPKYQEDLTHWPVPEGEASRRMLEGVLGCGAERARKKCHVMEPVQ